MSRRPAHLLVLGSSTAFAAPLLNVLGEPSGGVHFHGKGRPDHALLASP